MTFYPEVAGTCDGYVRQTYNTGNGVAWADIRAAAGNDHFDTDTTIYILFIQGDNVQDKWRHLHRSIFTLDTSSIPDTAEILSAVFSLYGVGKTDTLGISPQAWVCEADPASPEQLADGDFDSFTATEYSNYITYANWDTSDYNDFTFNADGRNAINKTGITELGVRDRWHDHTGVTPDWTSGGRSYFQAYAAEQGTGYKPKLVVTYKYGQPVSLRKRGRILGQGTNRPW